MQTDTLGSDRRVVDPPCVNPLLNAHPVRWCPKGSKPRQFSVFQLTSVLVSSKKGLMSFTVCMAIVVIMEVAV